MGHDVVTVSAAGWAGLKNGELLMRAVREFDAFVTVDTNLPFQRDVSAYTIAIIVLRAPWNRLADLRQLVPQLLSVLPRAEKSFRPELRKIQRIVSERRTELPEAWNEFFGQ